MKVYIEHSNYGDTTSIFIIEEDHNGKRLIAKPMKLEFEPVDPMAAHEPSLKIGRHFDRQTNFLEELSNALTKAGYKPKLVEEQAGVLKSTQYHLEDMRKLVFEKEA